MARSRKKNRTLRRKRIYNRRSYRRRQPNKRGRKSRKRHRVNTRKRQRGGFSNNLFLSKPQQYPPGGSLTVPKPGIQSVNDSKYYYAKNNMVTPTPDMELQVLKRGGGKHSKQRGGSLSSALESAISAFPGGTDLRDVYYKTTNNLGNLYSQYSGYGPRNQPPMSNYVDQPIALNGDVDGHTVPLAQYVGDGSSQAAKPQFSADYN